MQIINKKLEKRKRKKKERKRKEKGKSTISFKATRWRRPPIVSPKIHKISVGK